MATVVPVGSVWPSGSTLTITGQATTGLVICGAVAGAAFGTPTTKLGGSPQTKPLSGLASAQAFGTPTIKTTIRAGAGGVGSAQAFGTVTILAAYRANVLGVGTAQAFGTLTFRTGFTRSVGSVPSAQAFGIVQAAFRQVVQVGGIASAQAFGLLGLKVTLRPGAVSSAQAFGVVHVAFWQPLRPAGLDSAQAFGSPETGLLVFNVWLHGLTCIEDERTICGWPAPDVLTPPTICGERLCGGIGYFITPLDSITEKTITLTPSASLNFDLEPAGST